MTPPRVARFMVSLFPLSKFEICRLLDPGAGAGSLTCVFLDHWLEGGFKFKRVETEAYEIDDKIQLSLKKALEKYSSYPEIQTSIVSGDFIGRAVELSLNRDRGFTHAILNPPYAKINSNSYFRLVLRRVGIETVNLYSAFLALALLLLDKEGQLVAIIPRSFCNGTYFRAFREFLLKRASIHHIHLFGARDKTFEKDKVLQENIIIVLVRDGKQGNVLVSTSTDAAFADYSIHEHSFNRIVFPNDPERFIHIPEAKRNSIELLSKICFSLNDLGIEISTGPVVDFRVRKHIRKMPEKDTVPLLYPAHFGDQGTVWPNIDSKKPNAIQYNSETEKWLYPPGFYTVVRRFSPKEEKRRIKAGIVDPNFFNGAKALAFENHLNVFHFSKSGLPEDLVRGLALFLNSSPVDEYFRLFNGHTQVNATDLRQMKYPSREILISLGKWLKKQRTLNQMMIDEKVKSLTL